ncbi:UNKNOWN [Stylonychia lemnae]|uniref:Uncharacterized protein n=1 Tax=Stylonychia lemnae TaxID=5949 RepID=A0A078A0Z5_STYLE|nr:UNKNOWN [Stylonychia lemnae]|eukprot:CDW75153.1 UNKNOWN [Stylonychia lemnae]
MYFKIEGRIGIIIFKDKILKSILQISKIPQDQFLGGKKQTPKKSQVNKKQRQVYNLMMNLTKWQIRSLWQQTKMRDGQLRSVYEVGNVDQWDVLDPMANCNKGKLSDENQAFKFIHCNNLKQIVQDIIGDQEQQSDQIQFSENQSMIEGAVAAVMLRQELMRKKRFLHEFTHISNQSKNVFVDDISQQLERLYKILV